jgi:RNA polymerase sigma-70 factor (ECF subfamily)
VVLAVGERVLLVVDPTVLVAGVRCMTATVEAGVEDAQGDLRDLYAASYRRLVGVVGAVCGDQHEAEEAVQEAFVRLLSNWPKVSRYEDPEAWLRHVALRQVSNRRRKAANGLRAALRHGPPPPVPAPGPDVVDVERALAALPRQQRAVVVLHRLGLDTAAIAAALGVPAGTVKSRLARARAALTPLIGQDTHDV